jgi:hypothetical protein
MLRSGCRTGSRSCHRVLCRECRHRHVRVLVDNARRDLVSVHRVPFRKRTDGVQPAVLRPGLEIGAVRLEQMLRHLLDPVRSIDLQRQPSPEDPRCQHQIGKAGSVVGVQVRHEHDAQVDRIERGHSALHHRRLGAPDDAGADVDEVRGVVDDDSGRGSGTVGIGGGFPVPSKTTCVRPDVDGGAAGCWSIEAIDAPSTMDSAAAANSVRAASSPVPPTMSVFMMPSGGRVLSGRPL